MNSKWIGKLVQACFKLCKTRQSILLNEDTRKWGGYKRSAIHTSQLRIAKWCPCSLIYIYWKSRADQTNTAKNTGTCSLQSTKSTGHGSAALVQDLWWNTVHVSEGMSYPFHKCMTPDFMEGFVLRTQMTYVLSVQCTFLYCHLKEIQGDHHCHNVLFE